jgi:hypothetical protein
MANICTSASFQRRGQISTSDKCSSNIPVVRTRVYIEYTPKNLAGQDPISLINTCQPDKRRQPHFSRHLEGNSSVYIHQVNRKIATLLTAWQRNKYCLLATYGNIACWGIHEMSVQHCSLWEFSSIAFDRKLGGPHQWRPQVVLWSPLAYAYIYRQASAYKQCRHSFYRQVLFINSAQS